MSKRSTVPPMTCIPMEENNRGEGSCRAEDQQGSGSWRELLPILESESESANHRGHVKIEHISGPPCRKSSPLHALWCRTVHCPAPCSRTSHSIDLSRVQREVGFRMWAGHTSFVFLDQKQLGRCRRIDHARGSGCGLENRSMMENKYRTYSFQDMKE